MAPLAAAAQSYSPQYYRPVPESYYRGGRVRFAIGGTVGGAFGWYGGFGAGPTIEIGMQANDIVAAYFQHRLVFGDAFERNVEDRREARFFAASFNAFMFDLTLFETIQVGAGPSLDVGLDHVCPPNAFDCTGVSGPFIGVEAKISVVLGDRSPARRRGLALSAHIHPTFVDREVAHIWASIGVAYQLF